MPRVEKGNKEILTGTSVPLDACLLMGDACLLMGDPEGVTDIFERSDGTA
jgi:hypothetical protein